MQGGWNGQRNTTDTMTSWRGWLTSAPLRKVRSGSLNMKKVIRESADFSLLHVVLTVQATMI